MVAPNLAVKPNTMMFNKVTIKGAKQAVQMFGPAQRGVAMAVADCVEDGTIPADEADDIFICVGVFIHWQAEDDAKIQDYNYQATKESIKRAVAGTPKAADVVKQKGTAAHPFAAHLIGNPPNRRRGVPRGGEGQGSPRSPSPLADQRHDLNLPVACRSPAGGRQPARRTA